MKTFRLANPKTLEQATALLAEPREKKSSSTRILAGGQDLLTEMKEHLAEPDTLVNLKGIPGLDGVQATAAVRAACPGVAVVCLTASVTGREVEALYEAGAVACLKKDQELEEIVAAIHEAVDRLAPAE